jgi:hypothetical protein
LGILFPKDRTTTTERYVSSVESRWVMFLTAVDRAYLGTTIEAVSSTSPLLRHSSIPTPLIGPLQP